MIVIYTGIEEIDKEIQMNLRDSIVAHYSDYLIENNTFEGQTVIISPQAVEGDLHEFLFILKQMNMRVILLLKNQKQEEKKEEEEQKTQEEENNQQNNQSGNTQDGTIQENTGDVIQMPSNQQSQPGQVHQPQQQPQV